MNISNITFEEFIIIWARFSLLLILLEAYLTVNKIWIRKHEAKVAQSVSVSAQLIALVTGVPFVVLYFIKGTYEGAIGDGIFLFVNLIMIAIGIGFWVGGPKRLSFWASLKKSLRLERDEAGALLNDFLQPVGAKNVLQILLEMAFIDNKFDEREERLLRQIASVWDINFDELILARKQRPKSESSFTQLRRSVRSYLSTSPPLDHASQLQDVLTMLVSVDDSVSTEEQMMMEELGGMIEDYLGGFQGTKHHVFIAPQTPTQEVALKEILPDLQKEQRLGGEVLAIGKYHSKAYAKMVCNMYREAGFLTFTDEGKPKGQVR